jgi:hypothetical protein
MEKKYWVFIENERYRKAMEGTSNIFVFIYFLYLFSGGKSGYGMISQLDNKTNNFVHKEMWIDRQNVTTYIFKGFNSCKSNL